MLNIRDISLLDILPSNLKTDPKVNAAALALDNEFKAVTEAINECLFVSRIDKLSESVLDHLAWERHVDFYDSNLPIEKKRELVKNAIPWHRRKGTPATVEELLITLFDEGQVVEWFDYGGEPYMFKIVTPNAAVTQEKATEFIQALNSVKNKRSWLEKVEITQSESVGLYIGNVIYVGDYITIEQVV